jgi:hypothetical protein
MTAEPPDLDALAKRYLDLWQDQVAALSTDPEVARTLGRYAQLWAALGPAGIAGIWAAAAEGLKGGGAGANVFADGPFAEFFRAAAAHGPAPAAAARGDRGDDLAELRRRLAVLEERLAAGAAAPAGAGLASEPARAGGKPRKRTRKPAGSGVP